MALWLQSRICPQPIAFLVAILLDLSLGQHSVKRQKLVVFVIGGFPGSHYYRFGHLDPFASFEKHGVWTDLLYPVYPPLPLPSHYSLFTGLHPIEHGIIGDYMYDPINGSSFHNFHNEADFKWRQFVNAKPLWMSAAERGLTVAMLGTQLCRLYSTPVSITCHPEYQHSNGIDDIVAKHDLTLVFDSSLMREATLVGVAKAYSPSQLVNNNNTGSSSSTGPNGTLALIASCIDSLLVNSTVANQSNLIVISDHGLIDVPFANRRFLDDHIDMSLIVTSVGSFAIQYIYPVDGKRQEVYETLLHSKPIPNVRVYDSWPESVSIGSSRFDSRQMDASKAPITLVANAPFAILTRDAVKRIAPIDNGYESIVAATGYNSCHPDMLGLLLAIGPAFRKGAAVGARHILDLYPLMCHLLGIDCQPSSGRLHQIVDLLIDGHHQQVLASSSHWPPMITVHLFTTVFYVSISVLSLHSAFHVIL